MVFPIIHAFFGDSASSNLDSEIAVFTEQCYQKREMLREKHGRKTQKPAQGGIDIRPIPASKRGVESHSQLKR